MRLFDELRFGPQRTLNLRDGLPTGDEAVRRAEAFLREQQVHGSREVLIITGRGNQSMGGVAVVRPAVEKLLFVLRRRGVVASHAEHNPGAFVVQIASLRSMVDAPARKRDEPDKPARHVEIEGLDTATSDLLRQVAERSLESLGVRPDESALRDEMHRYLSKLAGGLPSARREDHLRDVLRSALSEYE